MLKRIKIKIENILSYLKGHVEAAWYSPALAFLAAIDIFVIVIPTDGLLISSTMIKPRFWLKFALAAALGSTFGGILLLGLIQLLGVDAILASFPNITASKTWIYFQEFFAKWGLLIMFLSAISPFAQQPALIISLIAHQSLIQISLIFFVGRVLKYLFLAYICTHFPKYLKFLWGIQHELEEVGGEPQVSLPATKK